jgi:hypothetical protein
MDPEEETQSRPAGEGDECGYSIAGDGFDPGAIPREHPLKRVLLKFHLWRYISKHVPMAFLVSEFFFGAWMSCVAVNLVSIGGATDRGIVLYAVCAAYMVNIIWGTIDGWTYNLGRNIFESEDDRAIRKLLEDGNDERARHKLMVSLNGGPARHLSCGDREKVIDMILGSGPDVDPKKAYKFEKGDYHVAASFVLIDVFVATLTVLPLILLSDIGAAMLFSRIVTVSVFACVAYVFAKYLNRNWIFWVAVMSAVGVIVAEATFIYS